MTAFDRMLARSLGKTESRRFGRRPESSGADEDPSREMIE
jgi:hypothetical protein